jgi:hypothetical protein
VGSLSSSTSISNTQATAASITLRIPARIDSPLTAGSNLDVAQGGERTTLSGLLLFNAIIDAASLPGPCLLHFRIEALPP